MWSAPWTPLKFIFLLSRYSPFLDVAVVTCRQLPLSWIRGHIDSNLNPILDRLSSGLSVSTCEGLLRSVHVGPIPELNTPKTERWNCQGYLCQERVFLKVISLLDEPLLRVYHSAVILTLRTWVIWEKKHGTALTLIPFFLASWVGVSILVSLALKQVNSMHPFPPISGYGRYEYLITDYSIPHVGCLMSTLTRTISAAYGIVTLFDLGEYFH